MKLYAILLLFLLATVIPYAIVQASTTNLITPSTNLNVWLPVIVAGLVLSFAMIGIYYMVGYLFNNKTIRAGATVEFGKLIGIAIVIMLIIWIFYVFGSTIQFTSHTGQAQITTVCNQLSNSEINFLSTNNLISPMPPGATICNDVIDPSSTTNALTRNIDYGLGSVYVIEDNLTNQSVTSLNAVYMFSSMLAFLKDYKIKDTVCFPVECLIPDAPSLFGLNIQSSPFSGYQIANTVPGALGIEANIIFYFLLFQLVLIMLMLLLWPYLLAAGLIFETNMFTRRIGGFLIAMVISSMLVYPTIFLFEYTSLNNIGNLQPYGASSIPNLALCGAPLGSTVYLTPQLTGNVNTGVFCYTEAKQLPLSYIYKATLPDQYTNMVPKIYSKYPPNTMVPACPTKNAEGLCFFQKNLNFYVFPNMEDILNLYFTWPAGGNLLSFEAIFIVPGVSTLANVANAIASFTSLLSGNFIGSFPSFSYYYVNPTHTVAAILALINVYAIEAVTGFILPIFNTLILISSILEISKLLGGEGNILGLGKFI
jgi:hypothetical protein